MKILWLLRHHTPATCKVYIGIIQSTVIELIGEMHIRLEA